MRKIITLLFFTAFFNLANSQTNELLGKWVLDKVLRSDGTNLAINDPLFSKKIIYTISAGKLVINDYIFKASYTPKYIKTDFRKINYSFEQGYLKIKDTDDEKVYYFLKAAEFINRYPEYKLKTTVINNDTVYIANELADIDFKNDVSFDDFITNNKADIPSKQFQKLYFRVEFLLTKYNRIKDIKVLNSISEKYDNGYIAALKMAEKYLKNNSGKDLLITKEIDHLKFYGDMTNQEERKLLEIIHAADDYFYNNNFENAISGYSKIENLHIENNNFRTIIKEAQIRMAISLLAINNPDEACILFNKIGPNTDFQIRNYINYFCK